MTSRDAVASDGSPVSLYLRLPGEAEAAFIHRALPEGAAILELGCGAGRVTRHLVALGHEMTGVDNSPAMLAEIEKVDGAEGVFGDLLTLDLTPRRWPVVLLASHFINAPQGLEFLETAVRHLEPGGCVLVQRWAPGRIDAVEESTTRDDDVVIKIAKVTHPKPGVVRATMVYEIDDERYEQEFMASEVDDQELERLAASVGCVVEAVLGERRAWARLRLPPNA